MSQSSSLSLNRQEFVLNQANCKILTKKRLLIIVCAILMATFLLLNYNLGGYQQLLRVLQSQEDAATEKQKYAAQRRAFLKGQQDYQSLRLLQSNLNLEEVAQGQLFTLEKEEYSRLDSIYHFNSFKKELPFCLIVQNLNFTTPFLFQLTLNSIFAQNYSNYKAIIFSQAEEGNKLIDNYFQTNPIGKAKYVLIKNKEKKGIIENILEASHTHCPKDSISLNIVGNGELIGKNVLKTFNVIYQANRISIAYSNFYHYNQGGSIIRGYNSAFTQIELYSIRKRRFAIAAPVTYMTELVLKIDLADLKDNNGKYLDLVYDQALLFPMLDISCRKALKMDGYHLAIKQGITTYSSFKKSLQAKSESSVIVRSKKFTNCDDQLLKTLKKRPIVFHKQYIVDDPTLQSISQKRIQQDGIAEPNKASKNYQATSQEIQGLGEYLYKDKDVLRTRQEFQRERIAIADTQSPDDNKKMIKYNLRLGGGIDKEQQLLEQREVEMESRRIKNIDKHPLELPLCIVLQSLSFHSPYLFRFEYTLNSIFNQKYSNFFAVIINEDPHMDEYIRKYLAYLKINKTRYVYLENYGEKTPVEMLHNVLTSYCSQDSHSIILDGNGEIIGRNTLRVFSSRIQDGGEGVIYSCAFNFKQKEEGVLHYETTGKYSDQVKSKNDYRSVGRKYSQLLVFQTELYFAIDPADFKDPNGQFIDGYFESHLTNSLMELSCGKVDQIVGVHYLNNQDIRREVGDRSFSLQKKYSCLKDQKVNLGDNLPNPDLVPELKAIAGIRKQKEGASPAQKVQSMDFLKTNKDGLSIKQYLYGESRAVIIDRKKYQQKREGRLKIESNDDSRQLVQFNLRTNNRSLSKQKELEAADYAIIQHLHKNIDSAVEVPMCVIIDRLNFQIPFQFEYTLNSVFNQNYSNFFVVVANDGSKLGDVLLRKYLHFYDIPRERYVYLENKEKLDAMAITLLAVGSYCSKDSFVTNLAGNDEFIGRNVLKIFSAVSQEGQPLLMYSNSYFHWPGDSYDYDIAEVYTKAEIQAKQFRTVQLKHEYPFFFHSHLLSKVAPSDLQYTSNVYYKPSFERAITLPMFQMSCGRTKKVVGVHYLFNKDSKRPVDEGLKKKQFEKLSKEKKYECLKEFKLEK